MKEEGGKEVVKEGEGDRKHKGRRDSLQERHKYSYLNMFDPLPQRLQASERLLFSCSHHSSPLARHSPPNNYSSVLRSACCTHGTKRKGKTCVRNWSIRVHVCVYTWNQKEREDMCEELEHTCACVCARVRASVCVSHEDCESVSCRDNLFH